MQFPLYQKILYNSFEPADLIITKFYYEHCGKEIDRVEFSGKINCPLQTFLDDIFNTFKVMPNIIDQREVYDKPDYTNFVYSTKNSFLSVSLDYHKSLIENVQIIFSTINNTEKLMLLALRNKYFVKPDPPKDGTDVHMLLNSNFHGLTLDSIGVMDEKFNADNYEDSVVASYNEIVNNFLSPKALGNLIILNGPPGTGKTFFTKSLISSLSTCKCIIVSPTMLDTLDSPNLVEVLNSHKKKSDHTSFLFVVEDADEALVKREEGNALISKLLNFTDGIFGSMFNIKAITTTNANHLDFDSALLRPGRLFKHVEIGPLSPEKASTIYKRLTNGVEKTYTQPVTLASVYGDSAGQVNAAPEKKSNLGFGK